MTVRYNISRPGFRVPQRVGTGKGLRVTVMIPDELAEDEHTYSHIMAQVGEALRANLSQDGVFKGATLSGTIA